MAESDQEALQKIVVLMQAKDAEFKRAMDRNVMAMKRLSREGGNDMRKVRAEMKALDDQAKASIGVIGGWGKSVVAGMAGGVIGAVLGGMTTNIAAVTRGIAAMGDEAKRAGLGVEEFQQWKYVAEQNRIGIDALVDGFKELSLRADEFVVTGTGSGAEAFARLGYSATDLKAKLKDPSALMLEIIGRLRQMDKAAQIRIMDEVLGGAGGEQMLHLLGMSNDELGEMLQRARDLGHVLDESAVAAAAEIDKKFSEITGRISALLKGLFIDLADMSDEGAPAFVKLARTISEALDGLDPKSINETAEAMTGIKDAVVGTAEGVRAFDELSNSQSQMLDRAVGLRAEMLALSQVLDAVGAYEAANQVDALIDRLDTLTDEAAAGRVQGVALRDALSDVGAEAGAVVGSLSSLNGIDLSGAQGAIAGLLRILGVAADAAARLRANMPGKVPPTSQLYDDRGAAIAEARAGSYANSSPLAPKESPRPKPAPAGIGGVDWGLDTGGGKGSKGGGGGEKSAYAREAESIREQTAALEAEAAAFAAVALAGRDYGDAVEYARRYAELLTAAQKDGRKVTPELRAEIDALAVAYVKAGEGAEAARDKLDQVRDSAKRGASALVDIFQGVLDKSRTAKDAIGDLLMEMAKVQLKQGLMGAVGSSGLVGMLGSMLSPIAGARATGGSARRGAAYLVNENTPNSEIFVPSESGGILTVPQAQKAMADARLRAVAPARGGAQAADIRVRVYVEDDGKLAAVASRAGAQAALPVAVEVVRQNNVRQAQAQRRK